MKTLKDLIEMIPEGQSEAKLTENIVIKKKDSEIAFLYKDNYVGWVYNTDLKEKEDDKMQEHFSGSARTMIENPGLVFELSEWVGISLPESMTVEVPVDREVIKEVESPEQHRLGGMVQAYEKILLERIELGLIK